MTAKAISDFFSSPAFRPWENEVFMIMSPGLISGVLPEVILKMEKSSTSSSAVALLAQTA
jgi:hypothetical protein